MEQARRWFLPLLSIALSLFLVQGDLLAQETGKVRGVVTDAETGEPLPGANVIIEGTSLGASTDVEGVYNILNVSPGKHVVRVSMVGYTTVSKTDVLVQGRRTVPVNFSLQASNIAGQEITVTAEREVVQMDVSASEVIVQGEQVREIPAVVKVEQFLNTQPGIENMVIRGGGQNQVAMVVDGILMVDERVNRPTLTSLNLSAVQEISIITGGFNAEYGNVRSGVINVITKSAQDRYHGSVDYRHSPPAKKHFGPPWYSADNYYLRAFLDPEVAFEGTSKWDEETQLQERQFVGWNEIAKRYTGDDDPSNDMSPQEAQQLFMFRKFAEGGPRSLKDGDKADHIGDASIGGPLIPASRKLSFFASHRTDINVYPYPMSRDSHREDNSTLKLILNIIPSMKLTAVGGYSNIESVADGNTGLYYDNAIEALADATSYSGATIYTPSRFSLFSLKRTSLGFVLTHTLGRSTFYNLRVDRMESEYRTTAPPIRDRTLQHQFGPMMVDEAPLGLWFDSIEAQDGMRMGMHLSTARDSSIITTTNIRADITSQIGRYNQAKAGFHYVYNDLAIWNATYNPGITPYTWINTYEKIPKRFGAYAQDKLEVEGMIANIGVRMDYATPATDWYSVDRYSKFLTAKYQDDFEEVVPTEPAKSHLKFSPRLGVSHPLTVNSKIYFNYGHFYSIPRTEDYYGVRRSFPGKITYLGNPSTEWERTIAYELGYDHNLSNMVLIHLAGYYKDVADQAGNVIYNSVDGSVVYATVENNNYADIRGFEIRVDKSVGQWFTGWANYNYMVLSSGFIGRRNYYEDPVQHRLFGLQNPYQSRPKTRPSFRANVMLLVPPESGPEVAGFKPLERFRFSLFYNWRAGGWITYNPNQVPGTQNNLQWENYSNWNARISKDFVTRGVDVGLFVDITNLFNQKYFNGNAGFVSTSDREDYMTSLNLPESPAYENPVGNDRMGAIGGEDSHIIMPNAESATFLPPRDIFFGIKVSF